MNRATLAQFANILGTSLPAGYSTQPIHLDAGEPDPGAMPQRFDGPVAFGPPPKQVAPPAPEPPMAGVPEQNFAADVGTALQQRGAGPGTTAPRSIAPVTVEGELPTESDRGVAAGMPAGPQYVPAGWDTRRLPYRPETLAAQEAAKEGQVAAFITSNRVAEEGARKQAAQLQYHADQLEDLNRRHADAEAARQQRYADLRDRASRMSEDAASMKVQPGRLFADGGAGFGIMAAIGGALGGILQARQGGENQFLRTLDTMIDRDIAAQKANIQQGHEKANAARADYAALRTQLGDERLAEEVHRQRVGNWVGARLQSIAATTTSDQVRERANMAIQDLEAWKADRAMQMDQMSYRSAMMVGGAGAGGQVDQARVVRLPDGTVKIAPDATTGNDLNKRVAFQQELANNDRKALALRDEFWGAGVERKNEIRLQLNALQDSSMNLISNAADQGVVREPDAARMKSGRVNYATLSPGGSKALREMSAYDQKQIVTHVNQRASEVGQAGYTIDARGNIVPRATFQGAATKPASGVAPPGFKPAAGQ